MKPPPSSNPFAALDQLGPLKPDERLQGKLIKGQKYELAGLLCMGWTAGDGSGHQGYEWRDYFRREAGQHTSGVYLGPDIFGIEPLFAEFATLSARPARDFLRSEAKVIRRPAGAIMDVIEPLRDTLKRLFYEAEKSAAGGKPPPARTASLTTWLEWSPEPIKLEDWKELL